MVSCIAYFRRDILFSSRCPLAHSQPPPASSQRTAAEQQSRMKGSEVRNRENIPGEWAPANCPVIFSWFQQTNTKEQEKMQLKKLVRIRLSAQHEHPRQNTCCSSLPEVLNSSANPHVSSPSIHLRLPRPERQSHYHDDTPDCNRCCGHCRIGQPSLGIPEAWLLLRQDGRSRAGRPFNRQQDDQRGERPRAASGQLQNVGFSSRAFFSSFNVPENTLPPVRITKCWHSRVRYVCAHKRLVEVCAFLSWLSLG